MGGLISTLSVILAIFLFSYTQAFAQETLHVCPACKVNSLKEAVAQASPGDRVLVGSGHYREHNILIDKPLRIRAEPNGPRPIIDGEGKGSVLLIQAEDVEISGLKIENSGFNHMEEQAGIKLRKSTRCLILDNHLENNAFGIYVGESNSCILKDNQVKGTLLSESQSGNGIHIWKSENMRIENNLLTGNRDGIYFEFVKNSAILKNTSFANIRYGLHFMFSHNNEYRENTFRDNDCGVAVMYSKHIQMIRNRFERSRGPVSYGILLKDISDSSVSANTFLDNTVGIFLEGTTRTHFEGNLFKNNGWALRVLGNTDSNLFTRNDFLSNTFDVRTNAQANQNEFTGNYWSRYRGLDLDRNGFGDDAHRPVQLTSMLMEQSEVAILLMQSVFFTMLDKIENVLPVLTPETFKDRQPRMTRATGL